MMVEQPEKSMDEVIREDGRYPPEAFAFLHEGLARAVKDVHGGQPAAAGQRHVSGEQLCLSLGELARERWGMLARTVLRSWNVNGTVDFGRMVYLLVDHGFMRKTEEDSLEDFRDVYDFDKAFPRQYELDLKE